MRAGRLVLFVDADGRAVETGGLFHALHSEAL